MENLIWLLVPPAGVALVSAISRHTGLVRTRTLMRAEIAAVVLAGLLGVAFAPRCMCKDPMDMLAGSALFAALLGVTVGLLFYLGWLLFQRQRSSEG